MRGPWWEQTPHSCWHWGCLGTTHTVWEAAPTYLAVLLGPGATGNLATPDPSKMIGSSSEDGSQHSRRQGLEMNMEQREMRRKKKKKSCGFFARTNSGWRNPLTCWFERKGLQGEEYFSFVQSLNSALIWFLIYISLCFFLVVVVFGYLIFWETKSNPIGNENKWLPSRW